MACVVVRCCSLCIFFLPANFNFGFVRCLCYLLLLCRRVFGIYYSGGAFYDGLDLLEMTIRKEENFCLLLLIFMTLLDEKNLKLTFFRDSNRVGVEIL
jgi:hypothetical protein